MNLQFFRCQPNQLEPKLRKLLWTLFLILLNFSRFYFVRVKLANELFPLFLICKYSDFAKSTHWVLSPLEISFRRPCWANDWHFADFVLWSLWGSTWLDLSLTTLECYSNSASLLLCQCKSQSNSGWLANRQDPFNFGVLRKFYAPPLALFLADFKSHLLASCMSFRIQFTQMRKYKR